MLFRSNRPWLPCILDTLKHHFQLGWLAVATFSHNRLLAQPVLTCLILSWNTVLSTIITSLLLSNTRTISSNHASLSLILCSFSFSISSSAILELICKAVHVVLALSTLLLSLIQLLFHLEVMASQLFFSYLDLRS